MQADNAAKAEEIDALLVSTSIIISIITIIAL